MPPWRILAILARLAARCWPGRPTGFGEIVSGGVSLYYASSLYNSIKGYDEEPGPVAEIGFNYKVLDWNYSYHSGWSGARR